MKADDQGKHVEDGSEAIKAAVVVLMCSGDRLLLIKRSNRPGDRWASHIAFPGGRLKQGEDPLAAAKREFREEVGLNADNYRYTGELDTVFPNSQRDMLVKPYVFTADFTPEPKVNGSEVEEARFVPVSDLCSGRQSVDGRVLDVYVCGDWVVWGMTKRVIDDLLKRLKSGFADTGASRG